MPNVKRSAPLRPRRAGIGKTRKPSETLRAYGPPARRRFVTALPCVYCVAVSPMFALVGGKRHQAHVETGGTGRKADADKIVPLCASHHRRYDEHRFPFDMQEARDYVKSWAPKIEAAWQAKLTNPEHIGTILTRVLTTL
jgi:hypothetical protein